MEEERYPNLTFDTDWMFDNQDPASYGFDEFGYGAGDMFNPDAAITPMSLHPSQGPPDQFMFSDIFDSDPAVTSTRSELQSTPLSNPKTIGIKGKRQPAGPKHAAPRHGINTRTRSTSQVVHGQITPPLSDSSSPSVTASDRHMDTIDPSIVMPGASDAPAAPESGSVDSPSANNPSFFPALNHSETPAAAASSSSHAPVPEPPKVKSKRGRKKKILAPAAKEAQRMRTLQRNRAAAQRCRQRKKVEHASLEQQSRTLTKERVRLQTLVGSLRDELLSLKGAMLSHASCADMDGNVAAYVQQQRKMLMAGQPIDSEASPKTHDWKDLSADEEDHGSEGNEDEDELSDDELAPVPEIMELEQADVNSSVLPSIEANASDSDAGIAARVRSQARRRKSKAVAQR